MDLNRLRTLAGLEPIVETVALTESDEQPVEEAVLVANTGKDDSEYPEVTVMKEFEPDNKLNLVNVEFNDDKAAVNVTMTGADVEKASKVVLPADVKKHVARRIAELRASIEQYDEKGYDDKSVKVVALEALEKLQDHINAGTSEEFKMAQVYYGTLMSPITDMFPSQLVNFLHSAKEKVSKKLP